MRRKTVTALILITLVMTGSALTQTAPIPATPAGNLIMRAEAAPPRPNKGIRPAPTSDARGQISWSRNNSQVKRSELETLAGLEACFDRLDNANEFAGAVLVAKNGYPIFRRAYGLASREYGAPNRPDTKFNLGSMNKVFTQIAIGRLIEQGRVSLDDTIGIRLPDYPNQQARESVTVRHLLAMTSGIGDIFDSERYRSTPKDRLRTINDYLPLFAGDPLAFEPGTRFAHSNGSYVVLGALYFARLARRNSIVTRATPGLKTFCINHFLRNV